MTEATQKPDHRRRAWVRGQMAESFAALALRLKGYRILERQYRTPVGEIDIVARRHDCLVFVEVKARNDERNAREAITPRQQSRITRAAQVFVQRHPGEAACQMRCDAVLVLPWRWPCHIPDAWRES